MASSMMEEITNTCEIHIKELMDIWDYIGYENVDRRRRVDEIAGEIKQMLEQNIAKEHKLRMEIESEIEVKKREITQLCQLLKINTYFPPRDLSSFNLLKILQSKTNELEEIRNDRQKKFLDTYKQAVQLLTLMSMNSDTDQCRKMKINMCTYESDGQAEIKVNEEYIPTEVEIDEFQAYLQSLNNIYQDLLNSYNDLMKDIGRIAADIEYNGESDFERIILKRYDELSNGIPHSKDLKVSNDLLSNMQNLRLKLVKRKAMLVSTCEELRTYLLSMWYRLNIDENSRNEFMQQHSGYKPDTLEALQEEVSRCQQMKWEQIATYYSGLLEEKEEVENKLLISSNNSDCPPVENLTEEIISSLERDVDQLKEKYERHQTLYDTVANYQKLWMAYLDVENQMKDPNILSNRGGILLKTEKEKKRILKELPKTEAIVSEAIMQYEKMNSTKFFVWNNFTFKDYVEHLWSEFRRSKETSKYKRPQSGGTQSVTSSPRRVSAARVK